MGCRNDYLEPTAAEKTSQHLAYLIRYVLKARDEVVPHFVESTAENQYGGLGLLDRLTRWLCNICTDMPEWERQILLEGKKHESRQLADWWEQHQKDDASHEQEDAETARLEALRDSAKKKLTREEIDALLSE